MRKIDLRLIYVVIAVINTVENKKYDIEQQCMQDYGLNLEGVLRQFRRSDDYVKILKMRVKDYEVYFMDIIYQSYDWNMHKMKQQIEADFGLNVTTPPPLPPTTTMSGPAGGVKLSDCNSTQRVQRLKSRLGIHRRQGEPRLLEKSLQNIRRIDQHPKLNLYLTVKERNHYRDMGFQYAGDIIHTVIQAFGGSVVDSAPASYGSTSLTSPGETIATTKHMLRHTVDSPDKKKPSTESHEHEKPNRYFLVSKYQPLHRRDY